MSTPKRGRPAATPEMELTNSFPLRFFRKEDDAITELQHRIGPGTGISKGDLIRECIRSGLPAVLRKYQKV